MIAHETNPGTEFFDANTLARTGLTFKQSVPGSISPTSVITDNTSWPRKYPNDKEFVTLEDASGQRLIYHGECGYRPDFLSESRILLIACGQLMLLDIDGRHISSARIPCCYATFAGVSQNGTRFAIHFSDSMGDPSETLYERFVIYDTETLRAVAVAVPRVLGERQSWSAFSANGNYFAIGSPDALSLFQLPTDQVRVKANADSPN